MNTTHTLVATLVGLEPDLTTGVQEGVMSIQSFEYVLDWAISRLGPHADSFTCSIGTTESRSPAMPRQLRQGNHRPTRAYEPHTTSIREPSPAASSEVF